MAVGFGSLEIARSGLYVSERGLFVTGHNLSNVNTPGFTRQQAIIATSQYTNNGKYQLGLGADIQKIRQIRHSFLDNVYRKEAQTLGYWETRQKTFQDVQAILGEPMGNGLQKVMNQFWDSWQELSKEPQSLTVRALVKQRADSLVRYFNHVGSQLDKLQSDLDSEIQVRINEINNITENIARLNIKIKEVEATKDTPNDLMDQRNLLIDKLCRLIDCEVTEMQDGQIDITVGGYFLVNKGSSEVITAKSNKTGSTFVAPYIEKGNTLLPLRGGILKGLLESRGEVEGSRGSSENGSPYNKIDLVFAFNLNDNADQKDFLAGKIRDIVKQYTDKGIEVRLGYTAFDDSGVVVPTSFHNAALGADGEPDVSGFINGVNLLTFTDSASSGGKGIEALSQAADDPAWDRNTARQYVLISKNAIDTTGANEAIKKLNNGNIRTLVISDSSNRASMDSIGVTTGDRFIDINDSTADSISGIVSESIRNNVFGGKNNGLNIISDVRERLNLVLSSLVREVNRLHRSGTTLDGKPGEDFFVVDNSFYPLEMGNVRLNKNLSNLNNIVSSIDGSPGDNTIALEIAAVRHIPMLGRSGRVLGIDDFYREMVMVVGNGGSEAKRVADSQRSLVNSIDNQRLSISNVSMDEEMTAMMKFQFAYGASAKVLNVLDEMIESIVNRMGIVGR